MHAHKFSIIKQNNNKIRIKTSNAEFDIANPSGESVLACLKFIEFTLINI